MAGYLVKYGSSNVYVAGSDTYAIHDASLGMKTDAVSTFGFTMPPTHPLRGTMQLQDLSNPIRVWFDDELLFCGYVTRMVETINMQLQVDCVSDLQLLANVHVRIEDHPQGNGNRRVYTAPQLFSNLISYYNGLVTAARRFTIGHTIGASAVGYYDSEAGKTVVDASASTPTGILDLLSSSILEPYNCMLRVWYENGTRYIGLYTAAPTTNSQRIEFGENMTEFMLDSSTDELYTGCYPTGGSYRMYDLGSAKRIQATRSMAAGSYVLYVKSLSGNIPITRGDIILLGESEFVIDVDMSYSITTSETSLSLPAPIEKAIASGTSGYYVYRGTDSTNATVTLKRIADGTYETDFRKVGELVYDVAAVTRYGLHTFTFSDSDVRYTDDLLSKAIAELRQKTNPTITLAVDGVDMALYMSGYTHLLAGQKVRVVSAPHNVDTTMQVTEAALNLDNPTATKYTLGSVPRTAMKAVRDARADARDVRDMLVYDINDVITGAQIMRLV